MTGMWIAAVALAHSPLVIGCVLCFVGAVWVDVVKRRG